MSPCKSYKTTTSQQKKRQLYSETNTSWEKPQPETDSTYISCKKVAPWIFDNTRGENRSLGEAEGRSPEEPLDEIWVWSGASIMFRNAK